MLEEFLQQAAAAPHRRRIRSACFSVAGPVIDQRCKPTNLDWTVDARDLTVLLGSERVLLLNDFEAAAFGVGQLPAGDFVTLQEGELVKGAPRVVLGAGTGLGVAQLTWKDTDYAVHASEGGHADFAPADEVQDGLLRHMRARYGHVSYERVVSGPGLVGIFEFLAGSGRGQASPELAQAMRQQDPAAAIAEFAAANRDALALQTLELFVSAYGAFAGNLALLALARGGVFLAGGVAPKISAFLQRGAFLRAFTGKGRFGALLERIPVRIVMNQKVGVIGAAAMARGL
jgi:glucokinase